MPVRRDPHQPDQVGRRGRLDQEPGRSGAQRAEHILIRVEGGQHDHDGRVGELADLPDRGEAVHAGHAQVHEHQIGPAADHGLHPGRSVVRLVHDLDVTSGAENRAQVRADHRLVVHDHDPDHAGLAAPVSSAVGTYEGSTTSSRNPPSGVGPARSVPWISSMR